MTAAGKINASNLTIGDRIIVKETATGAIHESRTKTGENVYVVRVIGKSFRNAQGPYEARGKYVIETTAGTFEAAPIQTMFLAPEDAAGIKRAHVEALADHADFLAEQERAEASAAAAKIEDAQAIARTNEIEIAEQIEAIETKEQANAAGAALGDAWAAGRISTEKMDELASRHAYKCAAWKAAEVGDFVSFIGEKAGAVTGVVVAVGSWVEVWWTRHANGQDGKDRMPVGEFRGTWQIHSSDTWARKAEACDNRWHTTAPARMRMLCPHCPV